MLQQKAALAIESKNGASTEDGEEDGVGEEIYESWPPPEQTEEFERIEGLREQVAQFDVDISNTETLLTELSEAHGGAEASMASYAEKKAKLEEATQQLEELLENDEHKAVLESMGIHSVADLLEAEGFAEADQVVAAHEQQMEVGEGKNEIKAKINERMNAKKEAQAALIDENPEMTLTYNELADGLKERIDNLNQKRKETFWQTPEGKEAKQEELRAVVKEKISQLVPEGASPNEVIAMAERVVGEPSLLAEETNVFGESDVRASVAEALKDRLGECVEGEYYQANPEVKREEAAQEKYEAAAEGLRKFELSISEFLVRSQEIQSKLAEYMNGSDGENFRKSLGVAYFKDTNAPADKVIQRFFAKQLSPLDSNNHLTRGHGGERFDSSLDGSLSTVDYIRQCVGHEQSSKFMNNLYAAIKGESRVPDPESLVKAVEAQQKMFDVMEAFLDSPERGTLQAMGKFMNEDLKNAKKEVQIEGMDFALSPVEGARDLPASADDLRWAVNDSISRLNGEKRERQRELEQVLAG